MLVDWLFEKHEQCEQREPTATENSRIFSFFGTWVTITNFTYLDWGELLKYTSVKQVNGDYRGALNLAAD